MLLDLIKEVVIVIMIYSKSIYLVNIILIKLQIRPNICVTYGW